MCSIPLCNKDFSKKLFGFEFHPGFKMRGQVFIRSNEGKFKIKTRTVIQFTEFDIVQVKIFKGLNGILQFKIGFAEKMQLIYKIGLRY